jgi:regulatory protein YycI of two-component signal transduction system YycFG
MQWGQIKTLFILCFLLLDIYLLTMVLDKHDNNELDYTADPQDQELEEKLKLENIEITDELPNSLSDEEFIIVQQKTFNKDEMGLIKSKEKQEVEVINSSFIISLLKESVAIPENASREAIEQLVTSTVYLGNEYTFGKWDEQKNVLLFFQEKKDRPVYYNQNGMLLVYLNDKNEMVGYSQSYLGEPELGKEERPIIKPINAIKKLFDNNLLLPNEKVTDMEIGYYTTLPLDSGRQVLSPTWKITINENRDRFVNAMEQYVIPVNDKFIGVVIQSSIDNLRSIKGKEEFKISMLEILTSKLPELSE